MSLVHPGQNLHERPVEDLARSCRKGVNTVLVSNDRGDGKSYVLLQVIAALVAAAFHKLIVLALVGGDRTKSKGVSQLAFGLFDPHAAACDVALPVAGEGPTELRVLRAVANLAESHDIVVVVDNLQDLSTDALAYLAEVEKRGSVTWLLAGRRTKREAVRTFVGGLKCERVLLPTPSDRELVAFLDDLIGLNRLDPVRWLLWRLTLVKASRGSVGALLNTVERLSKETSDEQFAKRVSRLLADSKVPLFVEDYRLLIAIAGLGAAILIRSTTVSIAASISAVLLGSFALACYRIWAHHGRVDDGPMGMA